MTKSNRLIHEKSPYLLQHANNPVDWYPWSEEAFDRAEKEDKLVFLSIGYATCHWCHVMERESFEDENVAEFLNSHFIPIKLDREERPDIDKIYMDAIQAMGTQGGWPLNIFLTPDKKPLTGGTYFPPVRKFGMKSFLEVLTMVAGYWQNRREEMEKAAEDLAQYLIHGDENTPVVNRSNYPDDSCFDKTFEMFKHYFDEEYFGFKTNNQNKFPPSMGLSYLLTYSHWKKDDTALSMVEKTLRAMMGGGIYDQVGGGLSRYSTDYRWLVPHFEKMLYDNALLLKTLVETWQVTGNNYFRECAQDIINYIERDLLVEGAGISCAEDADSEGVEGKFYVYTYEELEELLGSDFAPLVEFWNIKRNGNFEGNNILNEDFTQDRDKLIQKLGGRNFLAVLKSARERIFRYRSQRVRPLRDDKIIVSWNALYIQALALAGAAFSDKSYIQKSIRTFEFIESKCKRDDGGYFRRYREGEVKYSGNLVDYSGMGIAAIEIFKVTQDIKYYKRACEIADKMISLFLSKDELVFYETEESPDLIRRSINGYDGVEPSGNSQAGKLLLDLIQYGYRVDELDKILDSIFSYFNTGMTDTGISYPYMLRTLLEREKLSGELVLVEGIESNEKKMEEMILKSYLPGKVFLKASKEDYLDKSKIFPLIDNREPMDKTHFYVCKNRSCRLPITELGDVHKFCISPELF
ncbi:MAG: thioredoxin domain-containing protein [Leptospira sp.]|nr:thioredoxin domain-containing protein [Leptospira sp.]